MTDLIQLGKVVQGPDFDEAPPPLPDLQDAFLGPAELDVLFGDLAAHARIGEIILKGAATERADAASAPTLDEAHAALRSGAARGVQVRYLFEGRQWWDTLLRTPSGVRLVRIER